MFLRILFFLLSLSAFAQKTTLIGQIRDKNANPIPFGSVRIKNSFLGTIADSLGFYSIKANLQKDVLVFSSIGYFDKTIELKKQKTLDVTLEENKQEFSEVIIRPEENPAWKIVRKVLENKTLNNPDKFDSYQARTHSKMELLLDSIRTTSKDSSNKRKMIKVKPMNLIFESASDVFYKNPGKKKETIFAVHTNFLKLYNNLLNVVPLDLHKYHFYEELYNFYPLKRIYINPLNSKTFEQYDWELARTDTLAVDTIFHLNFKPYKGQKYNGFAGKMTINSNKYAVQEISLLSVDSTNSIEIQISQKYAFENGFWFPKNAQTAIKPLINYKASTFNFQGVLITDFKDVQINHTLDAKIFNGVQREVLLNSDKYTDSTFAIFRIDSLNKMEQKMYEKIGNEPKLMRKIRQLDEKYAGSFMNLMVGVVDLKYVELNVFNILSRNRLEGPVVNLGFQSKLLLNPRFGFHINPRYGFRDNKFKLNGDFSWYITKDRYNRVTLGYKNGYESSINSNNLLSANTLYTYDFQTLPNSAQDFKFIKINQIEGAFAAIYVRPFRYNWLKFQLDKTTYKGLNKNILNDSSPYNLSELSMHWRFAYKEVVNRVGRLETLVNRYYPIVNVKISKGLDLWNSSNQYWKYSVNNTFQVRYKKAGITDINHYGTYSTGRLPSDFLQPSVISRLKISDPQTLNSSFYASNQQNILSSTLFFEHDFNNILFKPKTKYSKPRISIQSSVNNSKLWLLQPDFSKKTYTFTTYTAGLTIRSLIRIPIKGFSFNAGFNLIYTFGPNSPINQKERFRIGLRLF